MSVDTQPNSAHSKIIWVRSMSGKDQARVIALATKLENQLKTSGLKPGDDFTEADIYEGLTTESPSPLTLRMRESTRAANPDNQLVSLVERTRVTSGIGSIEISFDAADYVTPPRDPLMLARVRFPYRR